MRWLLPILLALAVAGLHAPAAALVPSASVPTGVPSWAPAATARIHPGIMTFTAGGQCTANFVFYRETSPGVFDLYIGQAAHCASTGGSTSTNGCTTPSLAVGTAVDLGTGHMGTLAYSSWKTMQTMVPPESNPEVCAYNDLALVKVNPLDVGTVNPQVPNWGGPVSIGPAGTALAVGAKVLTYGNSELRFGVKQLSPKEGYVASERPSGWSFSVITATPGIPGDSGSGFMTRDGKAIGVLSTLQIFPGPGENGVGGLKKEVDYMLAHGGPAVTLGTAPFLSGGVLPDL
jgi:hypothetical protein